jgi:hypothetical protein
MDQLLKDLCIKVGEDSNLDECLSKYTKPRLKQILDLFGEKVASSAKKQEMAEKAEEVIKANVISYFDGEGSAHKAEMQSLCESLRVINDEKGFEKIRALCDRGFVFLAAKSDGAEVIVPQNIKVIFDEAPASAGKEPAKKAEKVKKAEQERAAKAADTDRTDTEKELIKYARALSYIYGVYPASQLKEVWDFNHQRGISPSDVKKALEKVGDEDGFYIDGSYIVVNELPTTDEYCEVLEKLERSDIYYYAQESVIDEYADGPKLTEAPEYFYIRSFITRKLGGASDDAIDSIMKELYFVCVKDTAPADVMAFLDAKGIKFAELEEFNMFIALYTSWFYGLYVWVCKGYKPCELKAEKLVNRSFKLPPNVDPKRHRKVSRNEPCPCGSGKKFKNCCAKLM